MNTIKTALRRWLDPLLLGMLEYVFRPHLRSSWGGAFNGQAARQRLFLELLAHIPFAALVETGTYRGATTDFMQRASGLPVYTVELRARPYGFAKMRFLGNRRVIVQQGDSRAFLRKLAARAELAQQAVFFYLDAHWNMDLPLLEELQIIFAHWQRAVVMIDDFCVPGDAGYAYDDYGEVGALDLAYLTPLAALELHPFFPAACSACETGKKRGCVVLTRDATWVNKLQALETLAPHIERRGEPA